MDHRSAITVRVDQAIFTSFRSPMGEGYRLIAAGPGIGNDERNEITQRSPSHGGLCSESEDAVGLLSYRLASGRTCVTYSCYAGAEPSGRSGNRVYSHIAIFDDEQFRTMRCNPVLAHVALGRAINNTPVRNLAVRLEKLELSVPDPLLHPPFQIDHVCRIISALLSGQRMIVVGSHDPIPTLEWLMMGIPASVRKDISTSIGLKFSLSRRIQLSFAEEKPEPIRRQIQGYDVQLVNVDSPAPDQTWPFNGWMEMVRRRWQEGRYFEIADLSDRLMVHLTPAELDRVASICNDIDLIRTAESCLLERLIIKYAGFDIQNPIEAEMIRRLRSETKSRSAHLQECKFPI